ncbi:YaiI/YqxD family protein [Paenibacillus yanchengensis]|uniref:UPF0178 protein ACFSJH_10285 n=1 Tax=Paenibacillus yanchengensis TaxID=2035833 RepID=A0ABW4YKC2_9BACL
MQQSPEIVVDADACPVKQEIVEVAALYRVNVCLVASINHQLFQYTQYDHVTFIQVDAANQSADLYIVNRVRARDIVVTADLGLAAMVLGKGAVVLSPRGEQYTENNIDYLLERRHELAKMRQSGQKTSGPKRLMLQDRQNFQQKMTNILQNMQENE